MCGNPYWLSPEVILGKSYDKKADVWAIGVVLYELVMLKKPFKSDDVSKFCRQLTNMQLTFEPLSDDVD